MSHTTSIVKGEPQLEELQDSELFLSQLIEGEQGEAREWDDKELIAHVKKEAAKKISNLLL